MSENVSSSSPQPHLVAGVFKLDYKKAGWPDLMKVAKEWAKDPNFYELIVRYVSEDNLGIQFVYFDEQGNRNKSGELLSELRTRFGHVYAYDVSTVGQPTRESALEGVVVLKGLKSH